MFAEADESDEDRLVDVMTEPVVPRWQTKCMPGKRVWIHHQNKWKRARVSKNWRTSGKGACPYVCVLNEKYAEDPRERIILKAGDSMMHSESEFASEEDDGDNEAEEEETGGHQGEGDADFIGKCLDEKCEEHEDADFIGGCSDERCEYQEDADFIGGCQDEECADRACGPDVMECQTQSAQALDIVPLPRRRSWRCQPCRDKIPCRDKPCRDKIP